MSHRGACPGAVIRHAQEALGVPQQPHVGPQNLIPSEGERPLPGWGRPGAQGAPSSREPLGTAPALTRVSGFTEGLRVFRQNRVSLAGPGDHVAQPVSPGPLTTPPRASLVTLQAFICSMQVLGMLDLCQEHHVPPRNIHTQGPRSPERNAPMGHCGPSPGHGSPFLLVCAPVWGGEACSYPPGQGNSGAKRKQVSEAPSPSSSVILSVTQQTCLSSCSVPGPVQGEPFLSTSKCSLTGSHTRGPWPKLWPAQA